MNLKKRLTGVLALTLTSTTLFAQAAGKQTSPEFEVQQSAEISEQPDLDSVVQKFIESKGWHEGENTKGNKTFFIAIGEGVIQAPRNHKAYINARVNAFEKALLHAKSQMVEYMGTEIETGAMKTYKEGDFDAEAKRLAALKARPKKLSIYDKSLLLIHDKLDKKLKAEGIDPNSEAGKVELKNTISSEKFKKLTRTLARARILGLQVYKTFEGSPKGSKGKIAVICIHSNKLQKMAESIVTGVALPTVKAKRAIIKQIPQTSLTLLGTYGVQQKIDENGNLVLVAYAQSQPRTKSTMSMSMAYRKAKIRAMAMIRQFAGENASVATDMMDSETTEEYDDQTSSYENDSAFAETVATYSKKMTIAGIAQLKKWKHKHPLTGAMVCGVVCTWSPQSANRAKSLKKIMKKAPVADESKAKNDTKYKKHGDGQEGSYTGEGDEGDEDAF